MTTWRKCLLVAGLVVVLANTAYCSSASGNFTKKRGGGIHLFIFDFGHVATPFIVCCWVLLASIAKIGFHHSEWLSATIPESCMLILLGLPIGFILKATNVTDGDQVYLSSNLFFYFLLPPIILDAGYFMPSQVFYLNIGTILLYAILGTIFNAFAVGISLYASNSVGKVGGMSMLHALVFGSLISAVDPVAVLAVFEEVHVHEILYMLVFGESVLNDAASVVLYRTFESLLAGTVDAKQIGLAIASFFIVSIGGTLIGIIFALVTCFITKFTEHVRVIEPVFVFLMAYMAYLTAEIFHFSGIMSILFCGIIMKPYVESNVSRKSHTTIKYFLKLLSSSCESVIFMFLGVSLVNSNHEFNFPFICLTLLFISVYRAIGVVILTGVANRCGRLTKVKKVEQFIMSYGGLRGAVAFCLAILLEPGLDDGGTLKNTVVTTTISVVLFTVFVQGTTIKKLVDVLGVKKAQKREKSMSETVNDRVLSYMVAGVEEIIGVHGHGFWRNVLENLNRKYLRHWLERDPELFLDEDIVAAQRRIAFRNALAYAKNPSMIMEKELGEAQLNSLKRNPSFAIELAMKAQEDKIGVECGLIDINILSADRGESSCDMSSEAFNPRTIGSLIPKARKLRKRTYSKRKYTLDSLGEKEAVEDRYLRFKRNALAHMAPAGANSTKKRHHNRDRDDPDHSHRHKRKNRHNKGRSKKPGMDTLPEVTEMEETVLDIKCTYEDFDVPANKSHDNHHLAVPGMEAVNSPESKEETKIDIIHEATISETENNPSEHIKDSTDEDDDYAFDDYDDGIHFIAKSESEPLVSEEYVPRLPSYSDSPLHLSQHYNNPILDRVPKQFTQRDKEDLYEASRWRSFSIDSYDSAKSDTPMVEVKSPWSEDNGTPPRKSVFEKQNSDSPEKYRERAFSIETGF